LEKPSDESDIIGNDSAPRGLDCFEFWALRVAWVIKYYMIRFLVVKLIYLYLNLRFNMCIIFTDYFFSERRYLC
jgi:hypothetical protein